MFLPENYNKICPLCGTNLISLQCPLKEMTRYSIIGQSHYIILNKDIDMMIPPYKIYYKSDSHILYIQNYKDYGNWIKVNISKINWSNPQDFLNKIKTYLTFS